MREIHPQSDVKAPEPKKATSPWLIAISVMLATFMEVLDSSVANVSLPHIAGNLSASTDEATWVLTSYLISNAIVLPATGWLSRVFGRKRLLMFCVIVFTIASCLCGLATGLGMLIFARVLQGVGGGALPPISQAIMLESFPREKRGMAMGFFSLGVVVAPIIGPTLGGWITDNYSWRWIFLINLPVGILAILMIQNFIVDPTYLKRVKRGDRMDFFGLGLMVVWLASMQIVLDKGQQEDWFQSPWIVGLTFVSILGFVGFVVREISISHPIVNLHVFRNRNFCVGTILMTVTGAVLYGSTVMLPLFLQNLMGYTALLSGMSMSPRGVGAFVTSLVVGRVVGKFDDRFLIAIGFIFLCLTHFWLSQINLDIAMRNVVVPIVLNGIAISFIFVPLITITMATLKNEEIGNATGIYNLMRNLGGGLGISVLVTFLSRRAQTHQAHLVTHLTPYDPAYVYQHKELSQWLAPSVGEALSGQAANMVIYKDLIRQSTLMAFVDNYHLLIVASLLSAGFVFVFRRVQTTPKTVDVVTLEKNAIDAAV